MFLCRAFMTPCLLCFAGCQLLLHHLHNGPLASGNVVLYSIANLYMIPMLSQPNPVLFACIQSTPQPLHNLTAPATHRAWPPPVSNGLLLFSADVDGGEERHKRGSFLDGFSHGDHTDALRLPPAHPISDTRAVADDRRGSNSAALRVNADGWVEFGGPRSGISRWAAIIRFGLNGHDIFYGLSYWSFCFVYVFISAANISMLCCYCVLVIGMFSYCLVIIRLSCMINSITAHTLVLSNSWMKILIGSGAVSSDSTTAKASSTRWWIFALEKAGRIVSYVYYPPARLLVTFFLFIWFYSVDEDENDCGSMVPSVMVLPLQRTMKRLRRNCLRTYGLVFCRGLCPMGFYAMYKALCATVCSGDVCRVSLLFMALCATVCSGDVPYEPIVYGLMCQCLLRRCVPSAF